MHILHSGRVKKFKVYQKLWNNIWECVKTTKFGLVREQKYLPGISNAKSYFVDILLFSTWNAWKIFLNFPTLHFSSLGFPFPFFLGIWYFAVEHNIIWAAQKCIMRHSMCTQTAHMVPTTEFFFHGKLFFWKSGVCHMGAHTLSH